MRRGGHREQPPGKLSWGGPCLCSWAPAKVQVLVWRHMAHFKLSIRTTCHPDPHLATLYPGQPCGGGYNSMICALRTLPLHPHGILASRTAL